MPSVVKYLFQVFPIPAVILFVSVVFSFPAWWVYFLALMTGFGASIMINTTVPSEKTPPKYHLINK